MIAAILPVRSLLSAIFMLMAGSGFLSTLISLQLEGQGTTSLLIGLVATAYFAGLTLGSLYVSRLIERVGHIRAFATFVSLFSASTLAYAVQQDTAFWASLRFVDGFCMAGVFVCLESWLNDRAEPETRGSVLAGYMIALYAGQAIGQFLLNLSHDKPSMPFMAASILLSLAVIPVAMTRIAGPSPEARPPLTMRRLYDVSPLGIVGAAITGLMLGAFYALGAVYVRRLGMSLSAAAFFMSIVIVGGIVLQWPIGRLSDRFDRRRVIVGTFAAAVVVSVGIALAGTPGNLLLVFGGLFGGLTFALYPLCVAHTNDRLSREERVGASGGLVLAYSVGAAVGPVAGATAMTAIGPSGLYVFIALCAVGALAFALWRQRIAVPVPNALQQPYQILPRTTPMAATLDPHAVEEAGSV
ncbi:MAG: MFS transporter [Parvibaculum sp.]|uniref:MFS transporter n=1 Tax=Parvibaculum sp. TaxID=2024848 RepID=UPI0025FD0DB3|nr:MFS transporter [Parvibaculum sp.]MCE9650971.1 MFS transporter [Parvibaculum sp.]